MQKIKRKDYPEFSEWLWRDYFGKEIDLTGFINNHPDTTTFFVGTDSRVFGKRIVYTSVIVAYRQGKGGAIVFHRAKVESKDGIRRRLLMEAMRSIECAWFLDSVIKDTSDVMIHLDVNSNLKYESSSYLNELVGLVVSQGFSVRHKPDAWAATQAAHSKVKN